MSEMYAYIGRERGGEIICVAVDRPDCLRQTATDVAKWLRSGLTIERVPVEWAQQHMFTRDVYRPAP